MVLLKYWACFTAADAPRTFCKHIAAVVLLERDGRQQVGGL